MSPLRWKFNHAIMPIWAATLFLPLLAVIPLMILDQEKYFFVFIVWMAWIGIAFIAMLCTIPFMNKKETQIELERYGYLFKEPKFIESNTVTVNDEGIIYTLDRDGAHMEFPMEEGEQVFDEAKENVFYIPWERAELALATQTYLRRIHIAVAVFSLDMDAPPFFVPLTEEVFSMIKMLHLDNKLGGEWAYLFYNPQDAFKQILTKGRIIKMRNKKTGKLFVDAQGNFIGDE